MTDDVCSNADTRHILALILRLIVRLLRLILILLFLGRDLVAVGFIVIHVCHEHLLRFLLVHKNISFNKFDAFVMYADLNSEFLAEEIEQLVTVDV